MTSDAPPELEYLRIEVHRLGTQVHSLRSALVIGSNCIADLMLLLDEGHPEQRDRARSRVVDAISEIDRLLSGPSFGSEGADAGASR
jgi:hypothetical protein